MRALRRAQLLAALKEKTARIPGASALWTELEAIEQVSAAAPFDPMHLRGLVLILPSSFLATGGRRCHERGCGRDALSVPLLGAWARRDAIRHLKVLPGSLPFPRRPRESRVLPSGMKKTRTRC